ncbi:unnamed protein product, partial [Pylaiella littoralis]
QTKEGPRGFGAMLEQNFAGMHDIVIPRVGARSPARNNVRQLAKAVEGTSAEARQALREISNPSEKSVDPSAIMVTLLSHKDFGKHLSTPVMQEMYLQLFARYVLK